MLKTLCLVCTVSALLIGCGYSLAGKRPDTHAGRICYVLEETGASSTWGATDQQVRAAIHYQALRHFEQTCPSDIRVPVAVESFSVQHPVQAYTANLVPMDQRFVLQVYYRVGHVQTETFSIVSELMGPYHSNAVTREQLEVTMWSRLAEQNLQHLLMRMRVWEAEYYANSAT